MSSEGETPSPARPGRPAASWLRRILPPPRNLALAEAARAIRDLVRGREPASVGAARRATQAEDRWRLEHGRALLDRGDPAGALEQAEAVLERSPTNAAALHLRSLAAHSAPIVGRDGGRALTAATLAAAVDAVRAAGHATPTVVLYHQASPDNPFQDLLYRRAWEHGLAPVPLWELADIERAPALLPPGARLVLHLHWVNGVLRGSADAAEAARRAAAFAERLDRVRAAGIPIVWTAHNVLPHDTSFPAEDAVIRRAIVERATLIHLLAARTPELARPLYEIPLDRTIHVPLPSFDGAYPDVVTRSAARLALDLPGDAWVLAVVGGLRPHKGLGPFLDAFEAAAAADPDLWLVVAGSPGRSPLIDDFLGRAARHPRIRLHARPIPADDMQLFLRAADVAVLPYLVTLNSAVLMMALAFDLPVIAPAVGGLAETVTPDVAITFDPEAPGSLADALAHSRSLGTPEARAAARRISEAHDADTLSDRLMGAIARLTATGS